MIDEKKLHKINKLKNHILDCIPKDLNVYKTYSGVITKILHEFFGGYIYRYSLKNSLNVEYDYYVLLIDGYSVSILDCIEDEILGFKIINDPDYLIILERDRNQYFSLYMWLAIKLIRKEINL